MRDNEYVSAIDRLLIDCTPEQLKGSVLFTTRFPNKEETKRIIIASIAAVYFLGPANNRETAELLNSYPLEDKPFEIIKLEV